MSTFIKQCRTTGLLLVGALGLFVSSNALAATAPGTVVTNTVDVDYDVGGVDQTNIQDVEDFTVDRLISFVVSNITAGNVAVSPGQQDAPILLQLTNSSNDDFDFALSAAQGTTADAPFTGPDAFDTDGNFQFYIDDGNGVFEPGAADGAALTTLPNVGDVDSGTNVVDFWVVDDIPLTATDGQIAVIDVVAQVAEVGGANITTDDSGSPNAEDTQEDLFDTATVSSTGTDTFSPAYTVATAQITVAKSVTVISDPVNGVSANAKAIPGAVMEYTITVTNDGAATAAATNVDVVDAIVANTTYVGSSITLNGNGQTDAADFPGTDNCDSGGGATVTCEDVDQGGDGTLSPGETATIVFRVTVN